MTSTQSILQSITRQQKLKKRRKVRAFPSPSFKNIKKKNANDHLLDPERGVFRNSSVFLWCHGSRDAMAATGSARWLLTGRDNTCKYNPAGFHGAFNVSRACGMDIAHACPRVENFQKIRVGKKTIAVPNSNLSGSISVFVGFSFLQLIFRNQLWLATTGRKYGRRGLCETGKCLYL